MVLNQQQIEDLLQRFPQWKLGDRELVKEIVFPDFTAAIQYVNAVANIAETLQHHPDIQISYNKLVLRTSSHDAGGITERDVSLVEKIEQMN